MIPNTPQAEERFVAQDALRCGSKVPVDAAPAGKRVQVVGAWPFGLPAAYHLTRLGYRRRAQKRLPRHHCPGVAIRRRRSIS
jgi:hypothetical protein